MSALRESILTADDLPTEEFPVPEWGVTVLLRGMTAEQRAMMFENHSDPESGDLDTVALYPAVLVRCMYDPETNEPIFSEADIGPLNRKSAKVVERVANACLRLSGMTKEEESPAEGTAAE